MADSWKVTLPCTRVEAEAIDDVDALGLDSLPTLMTSERVTDDPDAWTLDAYFEHQPDARAIAAIAALAPSAGVAPVIARLPDADWVTMSQAGLEPLRVGRFVVHTARHRVAAPPGGRAFTIDAGRAFGTGHHDTTAGCLAALDALADAGRDFANVVDLGTGTGLLAFAARFLWPAAAVLATDIDPVAIAVTQDNAVANGIERVAVIVADGARDGAIVAGAPYDLVIANILAGPLIAMAPEIAAIAVPHATIVLAGLLSTQADAVCAAYQRCGCSVMSVTARGEWSIVVLTAPAVTPAMPSSDTPRDHGASDGHDPPHSAALPRA